MMSRRVLVILAGVFLIGLVGVGLGWKGVLAPRSVQRRSGAAGEAVRPELILLVNGSGKVTLTPGTPLVFKVMIRNGRAARAALAAEARERLREELEERTQAGELSRQEAEEFLKGEPVPFTVPPMVITLRAEGFSFQREGPPGATTLPWRPKMVDPAVPTAATLDQTRSAWVTFVVAPDETASTAKDTYQVRASFEDRSPGQGPGQIVSNPVVITIVEGPRAPSAQDQKKQYLAAISYHLALKDYDRAIGAAQHVLVLSPQSIDGHILLGQAQEAKGDFRAALEAYESALEEFDRRYPDADHQPRSLKQNVWRMRGKLGIELPGETVPPASR